MTYVRETVEQIKVRVSVGHQSIKTNPGNPGTAQIHEEASQEGRMGTVGPWPGTRMKEDWE